LHKLERARRHWLHTSWNNGNAEAKPENKCGISLVLMVSRIVNIQMLMGDQNWKPSSRHKTVQVELLAVKSLFLLLEPGIVIRKSMHI
jgi:hypothetical protein